MSVLHREGEARARGGSSAASPARTRRSSSTWRRRSGSRRSARRSASPATASSPTSTWSAATASASSPPAAAATAIRSTATSTASRRTSDKGFMPRSAGERGVRRGLPSGHRDDRRRRRRRCGRACLKGGVVSATTKAQTAGGGGRTRVTGFLPPIATPMLDGKLDLDSLNRQLDYLADHVAGYLVGGSVGEVASLTLDERERLMRAGGRARSGGDEARSRSRSRTTALEYTRRLSAGRRRARRRSPDGLVPELLLERPRDADRLLRRGWRSSRPRTSACTTTRIASHTLAHRRGHRGRSPRPPRVTHVKVTDTRSTRSRRCGSETDSRGPRRRRRRALAPARTAAPRARWSPCR